MLTLALLLTADVSQQRMWYNPKTKSKIAAGRLKSGRGSESEKSSLFLKYCLLDLVLISIDVTYKQGIFDPKCADKKSERSHASGKSSGSRSLILNLTLACVDPCAVPD